MVKLISKSGKVPDTKERFIMIRKNKSEKSLKGIYVLPTSSRAHIHEPARGTAHTPGQYAYLLQATQPVDQGGYPAQVIVTSPEPIEGWEVDNEVETQHAEVRKNLPPRVVTAIVHPDGSVDGPLTSAPKGLGLPHWEFISANEDGSARLTECQAVADRIKQNKQNAKANKEAVRVAKKGEVTEVNVAPAGSKSAS